MNNLTSDVVLNGKTGIDYSEMDLPIWAVYSKNTLEYPGIFVARLFDTQNATNCVLLSESLEDLREQLPDGLLRVDRYPEDPPQILETWF